MPFFRFRFSLPIVKWLRAVIAIVAAAVAVRPRRVLAVAVTG